jgi:hypothetical protein
MQQNLPYTHRHQRESNWGIVRLWGAWFSRILPWIAGAGALVLYGVTTAPSIVALFDDSLEFQLVVPTFGIAHPTGYPLYVIVGGLWSRALFPVGNWAWRVNFFSALTASGAIALVFLLLRRLLNRQEENLLSVNLAALAGVIAFALGPVWWSQATVAEVYALHGLFVTAILYAAASLSAQSERQEVDPYRESTLPWRRIRISSVTLVFLLVGFSLTHHRTTLLLAPGLAIYLLWQAPEIWRPQRRWIQWATALLAPLLLYAFIPIRAAMGIRDLRGDYVATWAGFWNHVLARGYTGFFQDNPLAVERSLGDWIALFQAQFGWIFLLLGLAGLIAGLLRRPNRPGWVLIAVVLVTDLLFTVNYRVGDAEVFMIPAFLGLALGVGNSVLLARNGLERITRGRSLEARNGLGALFWLAVLSALVAGVGGRGPAVDRRHDWAVHDYAVAMAKVDFPPQSRVVGLEGQMTALKYMQAAEGLGLNATPVVADNPEQRRQVIADFMAAGYPVYLTQELAGIETEYSFSGEGPLVRVWPRGQAAPPAPTHPVDVPFAEGALVLTGYDLSTLSQAGGPAVEIALYWLPQTQLERSYKLSLRIEDSAGSTLKQEDRFPLHQVAPTWSWLPGEIIRDVHTVSVPSAAGTEPLRLLIVVYDSETVEEIGRWSVDLP